MKKVNIINFLFSISTLLIFWGFCDIGFYLLHMAGIHFTEYWHGVANGGLGIALLIILRK